VIVPDNPPIIPKIKAPTPKTAKILTTGTADFSLR